MSSLELINDLVEVPREGEHIGMLLLRELNVSTESSVLVGNIDLVLLLLLRNDRGV